jgi:hypothetical protein
VVLKDPTFNKILSSIYTSREAKSLSFDKKIPFSLKIGNSGQESLSQAIRENRNVFYNDQAEVTVLFFRARLIFWAIPLALAAFHINLPPYFPASPAP